MSNGMAALSHIAKFGRRPLQRCAKVSERICMKFWRKVDKWVSEQTIIFRLWSGSPIRIRIRIWIRIRIRIATLLSRALADVCIVLLLLIIVKLNSIACWPATICHGAASVHATTTSAWHTVDLILPHRGSTLYTSNANWPKSPMLYSLEKMWANVQPDGRPAEYRWRPLFNAAKFGWRPLIDAVQ